MKKFCLFIVVLLSSVYLYSQVESNPVFTEEYLLNPLQKRIFPGNDVQTNLQGMMKSSSKTFKYRQIAQMQEELTGGVMQYNDSLFYEYIFNNFSSTMTIFAWDVLHWALMNKTFTTYDQNYNRLSYEVCRFDGLNWLSNSKLNYTYNSDNQIISNTTQLYNNSTASWDNISRFVYEYDSRGNQIIYMKQTWASYAWQNTNRYLYVCNDSGMVTTLIYQTYDAPSMKWVNSIKAENVFDDHNNYLSQINSSWNTSTLTWSYNFKNLFTYDANGNNLTKTVYNWSSGSWVESSKYTNTYDGSNTLSKLTQYWNISLSQWVNIEKYEYTYNFNNSLLTENHFNWNNSASLWDNDYRDMYMYDGNGSQLSKTHSHWVTSAWVDQNRTLDTYDANLNKHLETVDKWDVPSSTWITQSNNYYYWEQYEENQDVSDWERQYPIVVYPNPVSTKLTIESPFEVQNLDLYNSTGQIVLRTYPAENRINLDLSNFSDGIYFLQLETIKGKVTRKIMVNK